jgi:hypothetical protein
MKKLLLAAVLGLVCAGAHAEAVLSCDDVDQVGEALLSIGVALDDENLQIDEGGAEHIGLADTVEGLATIAAAENDQDLANASMGMAHAWDNNDRDAFTDSLAEAVAKLAIISASECGH